MEVDNQNCTECGGSNWEKVFDTAYPERRKERKRTVKTVYVCGECDAEGKYFEHNNADGTDTMSGAFR